MRLENIFVFIVFFAKISQHGCVLRKKSENSGKTDALLRPVEFNNVTYALRIFPFVYYGYISRLSLSNLDSELVEKRLQEIYPFLKKDECGSLYCLFFYNPKSGSEMTMTALSFTIEKGEVFAKIKFSEGDEKDYVEELLISPCKGVLQYVWPNVSTPSIAFMLIARVQCSKLRREANIETMRDKLES
ncbi:hypothetical protein FG386_002452 [Cryptosporidium ryanae]|uniref:uncharacterized protein n=1 Tax=Cryptosporidium ryanae TaxID=515981 RepID=UPI00351A8611|nr:hypothetical protein FG386_002452 [Cryptosporidium ryanae]